MSMIGKTLGHYQIASQLGKGGMGEVYQAKDQKLGRDVAIKVLPEEFARDADRVARFQREAKLLASLNHPNIAAIHGLEESSGMNFLVLELVEGKTLAERIKQGPIPVEEALKLGLQITEALEAAHEKGIIHRDLKPSNIKITTDGKVKVLDFGLAKAYAKDREEVSFSNSPTLSDAATQQGLILGTAAYMSPEQARGKAVDKRADIWAFACVLYEMLTGQAAFQGEDVTEILASVVKSGANLDLLPTNTHPRVREVIIRCLQKDLKRRYHDIADVRCEIEQSLADPSGLLVQHTAGAETKTKLRKVHPWFAAIVVLTAIIAGIACWILKPTPAPEAKRILRFEYELPEGQQLAASASSVYQVFAISSDGSQFVYNTTAGLYVRTLDQFAARLLEKTEGARSPVFSPDGRWIAYISTSENQLKKIAAAGGSPVTLADAAPLGEIVWQTNDTIDYYESGKGIMRVSSNGGNPELISAIKEETIVSPQLLPDGNSMLFTNLSIRPTKIMVRSLASGQQKDLFAGANARYIPTGHIIYTAGGNLLAVPFDPKTLGVRGDAIPLSAPSQQYAVSDSGTLVYAQEGLAQRSSRTLVWVDRNGHEEAITSAPVNCNEPRISPDGTRIALECHVRNNQNYVDFILAIFIWDLNRKSLARLTLGQDIDAVPLWSPDGKRIFFVSRRQGINFICWRSADGTGREEPVGSATDRIIFPFSWAGDGKTLVVMENTGETLANGNRLFDIGILSTGRDHSKKLLLNEKHNEAQPRISPDGKWIAYISDESGHDEVYVRPFPDVEKGRWQVSNGGGNSPLWSHDGRELFYRNGDAAVVVSVETGLTLSLSRPAVLFRGMYVSYASAIYQREFLPWDVSQDGKRFLMMKETASTPSRAREPSKISIVVNWFEELKQRVPEK